MAEMEERIRELEKRLAQAEARIGNLETRQPEPVFQHGRLTYWPNTAQTSAGDPNAGRGYAVSLTEDGYALGPISGADDQ